jgi:hypothetical protein
MRFTNTGKSFTCVSPNRAFDQQVVLDALEWCADNAEGWAYELEATTDYVVRDFGEGFEECSKVWTFKVRFGRDDDALAFRLALDGLLAEAAC